MTSNSIFDKNMETVSTKEGEELTQGLQETPGDYSERPLAPLPFKHSASMSSFAWGTRECTGLSGPRDFLFTEALWFRKATGCSTMLEATWSCQCQNPPAPWVPLAKSSHPPVVSVSLEKTEFSPAVAGEHSPRSGPRSHLSINSDKTQSVLYHAMGLLSFPCGCCQSFPSS